MSQPPIRIRELAAWGLDDSDRPADYLENSHVARALLADRSGPEPGSALIEASDDRLLGLFAEQEARTDLQSEMAGLRWSLGLVDLRRLLAFQRRIVIDSDATNSPVPAPDDWVGLVDLAFGKRKPIVCDGVRSHRPNLFGSTNLDLHFRTNDSSNPIAVHSGGPFFEVAQYRERWFLRDGYHRAFRCLRAGIFRLPAVLVVAQTVEQLGAVHPWFFPEKVLFSDAPPWVIHFLDDALVIEYQRSPTSKMPGICVEETSTLRGTNL
jgi:hypothetical protein